MWKTNRKKGFTLVEIIVVLVILAVLIGASAPIMMGFINDARGKASAADARLGFLAAQQTVTEAVVAGNIDSAPASGSAVVQVTQGGAKVNVEDSSKFLALLNNEITGDFSNVYVDSQYRVTGITYDSGTHTIVIADGTTTVTKN